MRRLLFVFLIALAAWWPCPARAQGPAQRFVVGQGSQVSYRVQARILGMWDETIEGTAHDVRGTVAVGQAGPVLGWAEVRVADFRSGIKGRDAHVAQILGADRSPTLRFDLSHLQAFDPTLAEGRVLADGTLTIKGERHPLRIPLSYVVEGGVLRIDGETQVRFTDLGLEPPVLGWILKRAPNELVLRVHLRADQAIAELLDR